MKNIIVKDKNISIQSINDEDYISLTASNSMRLKMKTIQIQLFITTEKSWYFGIFKTMGLY